MTQDLQTSASGVQLEAPAAPSKLSASAHRVESYFHRLGSEIDAMLEDSSASVQGKLSQIAAAKLIEHNPSATIAHADLVDYVLSAQTLCPQADLEAEFGEPPITLYRSKHFSISALTWLDGTTSIHQHEFCGAFHVLQGASIHSLYRFQAWQPAAAEQRALAGQLQLIDIEVLKAGDTRVIERGHRFIHALFHMTRPSVTIVVRTTTDFPDRQPQYDYRWPGLALDPFHKHGPTIRKLQYLRTLKTLADGDYAAQLQRVLADADLYLAYILVSESLVASADPELARSLAQSATALPGAERDLLFQAAHYDLTSRTIISCRTKLHHPEHRLLLALLLNVYDRDQLLRLVQRETACDDPIAKVCHWIAEFSGNTERYPNLIEIEFNATALEMLACMLAGLGPAATLQQFALGHGQAAVDAQREPLLALYAALKECALFHVLFADLPHR